MTRSTAILAACAWAVTQAGCHRDAASGKHEPIGDVTAQPEIQEHEVRFAGIVRSVNVLDKTYGETNEQTVFHCPEETVIVDGILANWLVEVEVDVVHNQNDFIHPSATVPFAVHSPALLFWDDRGQAIGKTFEFTLTDRQTDSQPTERCRLRATWK